MAQWHKSTMAQWYNGSMVTTTWMKTRTRMTMMTLFLDITTNLVVGCIPVREGSGVFSTMISTKTARTRMTINYNNNNERQQQMITTNYNDQQQRPTPTTNNNMTTTNNDMTTTNNDNEAYHVQCNNQLHNYKRQRRQINNTNGKGKKR